MAGPAPLDLDVRQGDGFAAELRFVDADGDPYSVAVASWLAQVRKRAESSSDLVAAFDVDATDALDGVIRLSLNAAETALLPREAAWDLERTPAGGAPLTLVAGRVLASRDVSRGSLPAGTAGVDVFTITMTPVITVVTTGTVGPAGPTYGNIDGGHADTNFGGMIPLDAGGAA